MRLAIFAALPHEVKKIIATVQARRDANNSNSSFDVYRAGRFSTEIILAITGIGTVNTEAAARYIHSKFGPDMILSIGYGGAIYDGLDIGDLVWGSKFMLMPDPARNEKESDQLEFPGNEEIFGRLHDMLPIREGTIVTLPSLMKKSEIRKIISEDGNPVCDMETFAIARFCMEKGLSFGGVRSITDLHDEDIPPELGDISDDSGRYDALRAIRTFTAKPGLLPMVFRLARNSRKASQSLCSLIEALLETLR